MKRIIYIRRVRCNNDVVNEKSNKFYVDRLKYIKRKVILDKNKVNIMKKCKIELLIYIKI